MLDQLRTPGVWFFTNAMTVTEAADFAGKVESFGYSALWLPETTGRDPFAHAAYLATQTSDLIFATGIANLFHRHPGMMKQCAITVSEQSGNRFLLGIGVSHAPIVADLRGLDYSRPLAAMKDYLAGMDASPYTGVKPEVLPPTVIAALGPKMLGVARDQADGAHPYWTTPEHTAMAAEALGPDKMLCVEQKVVLSTDPTVAREAARTQVGQYATLPNYRNNWLRLGFTDDEIDQKDNRFVDAVVAWGDADTIQARVKAHYDAGATHVCIQPVHPTAPMGTPDLNALEALAPR